MLPTGQFGLVGFQLSFHFFCGGNFFAGIAHIDYIDVGKRFG